ALGDGSERLRRHVLGQDSLLRRVAAPGARQPAGTGHRRDGAPGGTTQERATGRPRGSSRLERLTWDAHGPELLPLPSDLGWTSKRTSSSTRTGISWNFDVSSRLRGVSSSGVENRL